MGIFGKKEKEELKEENEKLRKSVYFLTDELRCRINEIKDLREALGKPWNKETDDIMDDIIGGYKIK